MATKQFDPGVYETYELFGETYVVQPHPAAPTMRFSQVGGRGRVFQLRHRGNGHLWALKVFHRKYQVPDLMATAQQLSLIEGYEGMHAAKRRIILPSDPVVRTYPNLEYAMMMPWIHGKTWYDLLVEASRNGLQMPLATALRYCRRFLEVVAGLEESGMAHTDLSPGNMVFEASSCDVQLLDLEDMYMPTAPGAKVAKGSKGYRHPSGDLSGENFWRAEGDRYAATVLAAEILILSNRDLARLTTDEGFFADHRLSAQAEARFYEAQEWLSLIAPTFAAVFERAWLADTIGECPRVSELYAAAQEAAANAPQLYQFNEGVAAQSTPTFDFARWRPHSRPAARPTVKSPAVWRPFPQPAHAPPHAPSFTPPAPPAARPSPRRDSPATIAVAVGIGGAIAGLIALLIWLFFWPL
jgi:hypothetical protein